MLQKNSPFGQNKIIAKIIIALAISSIQVAACFLLYFLVLHIANIPKSNISWGLGVHYWLNIQIGLAIVANISLLLLRKKSTHILILFIELLFFFIYWESAIFIHPYRVSLLFFCTLYGIIISYPLIYVAKNKYNKKM